MKSEIQKFDEMYKNCIEQYKKLKITYELKLIEDNRVINEKLQKLQDKINEIKNSDTLESIISKLQEYNVLQNEIEKINSMKAASLEQKTKELQETDIKIQEEDLYIRKQKLKSNNQTFRKFFILLIFVAITIFMFCLLPSIKKRIEYNPYVNTKTETLNSTVNTTITNKEELDKTESISRTSNIILEGNKEEPEITITVGE